MLGGGELAAALGGRVPGADRRHVYTNLFTGEPAAVAELDDDGWKRLIDTTTGAARPGRDAPRAALVFHPHAETHVEYEDQIEAFLDRPTRRCQLCLDTGHHAYRGGDPVAFFAQPPRPHPLPAPEERRPASSERVEASGSRSPIAVADGMFCEPSIGAVDFAALPRRARARPTTTGSRSSSRTCTRRLRPAAADRAGARTSTWRARPGDRRTVVVTYPASTRRRPRTAGALRGAGLRCSFEPRTGERSARRRASRSCAAPPRAIVTTDPFDRGRARGAAARCGCWPGSASGSTRSTSTPPPAPASRSPRRPGSTPTTSPTTRSR